MEKKSMSDAAPKHKFCPACTVCGAPASTIELFAADAVWRLVYHGLVSGTGPNGSEIGPDIASAIISGFTEPYHAEKIRAADFYDDGGFCLHCGKFYCFKHWNASATGGGTCPKGHSKSLDPHWQPDFDDA